MPRYIIERTFPEGIDIPMTGQGASVCLAVIGNNSLESVTWLHSYVTPDHAKTFCIYEAPSEEAIRSAARRNGMPVDRIIEVQLLDPYFYK